MKLFKLEFTRMIRSRILQLSLGLLLLIGVLGMVLYNAYYKPRNDSRYVLLSLYNSYTQFTYLVLGFVFVSTFCKDFQNGVYAWFKQIGYDFRHVCIVKLIVLLVTVLPLLNIVFIGAQLIIRNTDVGYFSLCIACVNLDVIYIVILSLFISVLFKKVIQSTLIMYGLFIVFNGMNLVLYGMINPADSNSISSYYLGKLLNSNQSHYSLTKVSLQDSLLCLVSLLLPIIWIILLLIATVFTKRHRKV